METHVVFSQELPVKHHFWLCEEGGWRAEAYIDKGPKASDAAADQTGKWQQANTQDRAVEETQAQSAHTYCMHNTCSQ